MLCDRCHMHEGTVHSVEIINGVRRESHLCPHCAQQEGLMGTSLFSAGNLLKSFFAFPETVERLVCPECGTTLHSFEKEGLLGCAKCYDVFSDHVIPVLQQVHGTAKHTEKEAPAPENSAIKELKSRLAAAIQQEDFEEAARLRDEIRGLTKEDDHV